jgi:hypothetical protein
MHHRWLSAFVIAIGLALPTTSTIAAQDDTDVTTVRKGARTTLQRTTNAQPCALCFTCGGRWPHFGGSIPLGANRQVQEFGSNCSNPLTARSDNEPFLCCKGQN